MSLTVWTQPDIPHPVQPSKLFSHKIYARLHVRSSETFASGFCLFKGRWFWAYRVWVWTSPPTHGCERPLPSAHWPGATTPGASPSTKIPTATSITQHSVSTSLAMTKCINSLMIGRRHTYWASEIASFVTSISCKTCCGDFFACSHVAKRQKFSFIISEQYLWQFALRFLSLNLLVKGTVNETQASGVDCWRDIIDAIKGWRLNAEMW